MGEHSPTERIIRQELARILASPGFCHAPRQSAFIEYVVTQALGGHHENIKESLIGLHVFHKRPGYDPKIDSTVRTEATKLRAKLDEYYRVEGTKARIIITLPRGTYVPQFAIASTIAHRTRSLVALCTTAIILVVAIVAARHVLQQKSERPSGHPKPFATLPGGEYEPAFSPDGQTLAFVWDDSGADNFSIYTKSIAGETLTRVAAMGGSPAWSPDGHRLAFVRYRRTSIAGPGVYIVPSYGGLEQKVSSVFPVDHIFEAHLDWSPSGTYLAISDKASSEAPFAIYVLNIETGARQQLTYPPQASIGDTSPSFSPDGHTLAFRRAMATGVADIYTVKTGGGAPARITRDNCGISDLAWSSDGKSLLFASERLGSKGLWRVSPSTKTLQPCPGVADDAYFIACSRTGNRFAYSKWVADTNIWRLSLPDEEPNPPQVYRLLSSTMEERSAQYSPDGSRIVFRSDRSGAKEIWVSNSAGVNAFQLTSFGGPLTGTPRWSPDNLSIAFDSRPGGNADIFAVRATGGGLRRLTNSPAEDVVPSWSLDGKWIYFASNRNGSWQVWRVSSALQNEVPPPVQITRSGGFASFPSPDGKWLYYAKGRDVPSLWRTPIDGGDEVLVTSELKTGYWGYWTPAPRGIYFLQPAAEKGCALRLLAWSGSEARTLANLPDCPPFGDSGLSVSADGHRVLFTQVDHSQSDIFLVDPFR